MIAITARSLQSTSVFQSRTTATTKPRKGSRTPARLNQRCKADMG
jgi:hypothetical protein